jgi:feruloyl esterase
VLAVQLPAFCRVAAVLKPSADSAIKIEVWMPATWNGRLQGVGNGGLAGSISYPGLASALKDGYAVASTDTGHTGSAVTGEWALNHPQRVLDFGHRAVHEMTVAAKVLVKDYYGRAQHHAYWNGCSEGGNQALHEAQRYSQDYDGILAGAPANYMTHLQAGGMWISHAIHKEPASFLSAAKLPAINQAVLAACDDIDGLQDGIVDDPRACAADLSRLKCNGTETDQCLTAAQLNGLAKVYSGAKNPHTAEQIFPGYSVGSELEWSSWIAGVDTPPKNRQHLIADNLFKYLVFNNAAWDWKTFDFARDVSFADRQASMVNAINPNLRAFKQRGGKLLQYHGWYDPAISPLNSIDYFNSVQKQMGDTSSFYRLIMIPGMAHCGGGPGISDFDRMNAIVQWVEEGKAPDTLIATRSAGNAVRTRPLCVYPKAARYQGQGNNDDGANFVCTDTR